MSEIRAEVSMMTTRRRWMVCIYDGHIGAYIYDLSQIAATTLATRINDYEKVKAERDALMLNQKADAGYSKEEVAALRQQLADYNDALAFVKDDKCSDSEKHCGCVAVLRADNKRLERLMLNQKADAGYSGEEIAALKQRVADLTAPGPWGATIIHLRDQAGFWNLKDRDHDLACLLYCAANNLQSAQAQIHSLTARAEKAGGLLRKSLQWFLNYLRRIRTDRTMGPLYYCAGCNSVENKEWENVTHEPDCRIEQLRAHLAAHETPNMIDKGGRGESVSDEHARLREFCEYVLNQYSWDNDLEFSGGDVQDKAEELRLIEERPIGMVTKDGEPVVNFFPVWTPQPDLPSAATRKENGQKLDEVEL